MVQYKPPNYDTGNADGESAPAAPEAGFSIEGPMIAWVFVLVVALIMSMLGSYITIPPAIGHIASLVLFMPGSFILPIIIGAAIGAGIGRRSKDISSAMKSGALASIYAAIIYIVAIVIIYEVISYTLVSATPTIYFLLSDWLALPIATLIIVTIGFSILAHSSRVR